MKRKTTRYFANMLSPLVVCPHCGGAGRVFAEAVSVGNLFVEQRVKLGKTQIELAPMLGISRPQLANIEGGRSRPGLEVLMKAATIFGVSIDYLLGRREAVAEAPKKKQPGKRLGGLARARKLTAEQRAEIARKGAAARWAGK